MASASAHAGDSACAVGLGDSRKIQQRRQCMSNRTISFDKGMLGFFFIVSWLAVFSIAIMNGDDVVHFSSALQGTLVPKLHHSWTPNRMIDTYGRTIFASLFNFLFFSINDITKISFFTFYKVISASCFAVFATCIFSYFLRNIQQPLENKTYKLAFSLLIATAILQTFFWRNQVHFICYQLPAFLSFALLKLTFDSKGKELDIPALTGFVFLSYLSCFSLESFSLTIFIFNLSLLLTDIKSEWTWHPARIHEYVRQNSYPKLLLTNLFFSGLSLLVTALFSDRAKVAGDANHLGGIKFLLQPEMMPIGVALILLSALAWLFKSRKKNMQDASFIDDVGFTLYLSLTVLATTYIVCAKSNSNYFDLHSYPWGDVMLIGKIALLYLAGIAVAHLATKSTHLQPIIVLALIVSTSRLLYFFLDHVEKDAIVSVQAQAIYAEVATGKEGVLNTGFSLDSIPMQTRPFPSATSPQWFRDSYATAFKKYYGVRELPKFE
jgi:hypothetical protein